MEAGVYDAYTGWIILTEGILFYGCIKSNEKIVDFLCIIFVNIGPSLGTFRQLLQQHNYWLIEQLVVSKRTENV